MHDLSYKMKLQALRRTRGSFKDTVDLGQIPLKRNGGAAVRVGPNGVWEEKNILKRENTHKDIASTNLGVEIRKQIELDACAHFWASR